MYLRMHQNVFSDTIYNTYFMYTYTYYVFSNTKKKFYFFDLQNTYFMYPRIHAKNEKPYVRRKKNGELTVSNFLNLSEHCVRSLRLPRLIQCHSSPFLGSSSSDAHT
ncbi:hypothetical protein BpHYR1_020257 [Brachionus plicatilis]|uniref:Uncharacterized protein n=1 Tax=Brachionus plicatilis TaxID=10195 RepID=A0A3M7QJ62_BRAPC|nr:hypothetical protein BpHYR1_020257 [Brachionus plicatilis]